MRDSLSVLSTFAGRAVGGDTIVIQRCVPASSGGVCPVPPPHRDVPVSIRFASGVVIAQALFGMVVAAAVLSLAVVAVLHLKGVALLGAGATLLGAALLGAFGTLLGAGLRLRHLDPWTKPVVAGVEGVTVLAGALAMVAGSWIAGAGLVLPGVTVIAGISSPSAKAALSDIRPPAGAGRQRVAGGVSPVELRTARWRTTVPPRRSIDARAPHPLHPSPAPRRWRQLAGHGLPRTEPTSSSTPLTPSRRGH